MIRCRECCVWDGCRSERLAGGVYCPEHHRRMMTLRRPLPNDHDVTPVAPRGLNAGRMCKQGRAG